jgi:hypothetical protein
MNTNSFVLRNRLCSPSNHNGDADKQRGMDSSEQNIVKVCYGNYINQETEEGRSVCWPFKCN